MLLAILNFLLILYKKIELPEESVLVISLLSILTSVFYSIKVMNHFAVLDWVLELSSIALLIVLVLFINKKDFIKSINIDYQIVINVWLSVCVSVRSFIYPYKCFISNIFIIKTIWYE